MMCYKLPKENGNKNGFRNTPISFFLCHNCYKSGLKEAEGTKMFQEGAENSRALAKTHACSPFMSLSKTGWTRKTSAFNFPYHKNTKAFPCSVENRITLLSLKAVDLCRTKDHCKSCLRRLSLY